MNVALAFVRTFFVILSIIFLTIYTTGTAQEATLQSVSVGLGLGLAVGCVLVGIDFLFQRYNLRSFNIVVLGLFFGYLMGQALVMIFDAIVAISALSLQASVMEIIKICIFLFGTYLGTVMTLRSSDELYVSIPFVKFSPMARKSRELLLDISILGDSRLLDIASLGLLDHQLVLPRFVIKELQTQCESLDETTRARARRALDVVKKLEGLPTFGLRYNDIEFPDVKDLNAKLSRLARLIDAGIITADPHRLQGGAMEGIFILNIHALSTALKPIMQSGEYLKVKVQRYGKEARQGVGYLDDGTMVVVNGGGDFIGEDIRVKVLSVKHTTSGRMIFCNAFDEDTPEPEPLMPQRHRVLVAD